MFFCFCFTNSHLSTSRSGRECHNPPTNQPINQSIKSNQIKSYQSLDRYHGQRYHTCPLPFPPLTPPPPTLYLLLFCVFPEFGTLLILRRFLFFPVLHQVGAETDEDGPINGRRGGAAFIGQDEHRHPRPHAGQRNQYCAARRRSAQLSGPLSPSLTHDLSFASTFVHALFVVFFIFIFLCATLKGPLLRSSRAVCVSQRNVRSYVVCCLLFADC